MQSAPSLLPDAPNRERSLGSNSSQAPANSAISTRASRRPERKERSREALLTRGPSSPAYCILAKSEMESASRNAAVPMPIMEPT